MYKKMRLVSEEEYNRWKKSGLHHPPVEVSRKNFSENQFRTENLITDKNLPDDIKSVLISQVVKKLMNNLETHIKSDRSEKPDSTTIASLSKNVSETHTDDLLCGFPAAHKEKAKRIISLLRTRPDLISWEKNGVCTFNGEIEPASNIVDLLNFITTSSQWKVLPAGVNRFLSICRELNVPSSLLNSKLKEEFTKKKVRPRGKRDSAEGVGSSSATGTYGWQSFFGFSNQDDENND
jgi:hypothetical protein